MIFSTLNKDWNRDDTPQVFEGVIDNPHMFATWDEVEYCLNFPCFYDIQFIHKELQETIDFPKYRRAWSRHTEDVDQLFHAWTQGHGLVINNFDRGFKDKQIILDEIETIFDGRSALQVYAGLKETHSFRIHEDYTTNFIVQVEGETLWTVYKNRCAMIVKDRPIFLRGDTAEGLEIALQHRLKPGDMLYIPPRSYHHAEPDGKRLSVSIPLEHNARDIKQTDRRYYKLKR
tara:strand:- start:368 stop:1060 length:693 start_codon:yes stop_codon:yes gene_type:complete